MSSPTPEPTPASVRRRRSLGLVYILLAIFCAVVAFAPWPGKSTIDLAMWLFFAAVLLILGGWQVDKAAREDARISQAPPG